MHRFQLLSSFCILLFLASGFHILPGQVPLEFRKPDNTLLPDGTHILVLFQESRAQVAINTGNLPSPREYPERIWDYTNKEGLTKKQYSTSLASGKAVFVYALTPDDQLYMSSDHQGAPQFKKVVKGLIWVEAVPRESEATQLARRLLTTDVRLQLETTTGVTIPQGAKILVTRKPGQRSFRLDIDQLPSPAEGEWTEDTLARQQTSGNLYAQSLNNNELYFVYVHTPSNEVYFSSSLDGVPIFDQVVSGKILLSPLNASHPIYGVIVGESKTLPPQKQDPPEKSTKKPTPKTTEKPSQITPTEVLALDSEEVMHTSPSYQRWGLIFLFLLAGFALSFFGRPTRQQWMWGLLGLSAAFLFGLLIHSLLLERFRLLILFAGSGLALGLFQVWRKPGLDLQTTLQTLYTPTAAGLAFSFFFYELIEGKILQGSQLNSLQDFNIGLIVLISLAGGAFVYIFSLGFLFQEKDSAILKTLTWISLPVFGIALAFDPFWGMGLAVVYLFLAAGEFLNRAFTQSQTLDTGATPGLYVAGVFGLLLNFFIFPAFISIGLYGIIEHLLDKQHALRPDVKRQARLLGVGSIAFHLLFIFSFAVLKIDLDALDSMPVKEVLLNSLFFGSFGFLAFAWIGYSTASPKEVNA